MKKTFLFLLFAFIVAVLSACASVGLSYSLKDDNTMNVDCKLAFENPDRDVSSYLNDIGTYWADQGMAIYVDKDTNTLTGQKTQSFDSAKAAANAFAGVFASQDSIFSEVTFAYTPSFSLDTYSLVAIVSLNDVIRQSDTQSMPTDQVAALENSAKQGTYTISITLPGEVTATNADSRNGSTCVWNLTYGETTTLTLETQKENIKSIQKYNELAGITKRNTTLIIICGAAALLCILIMIPSVIIRRIKRKRASEIRVKHFR